MKALILSSNRSINSWREVPSSYVHNHIGMMFEADQLPDVVIMVKGTNGNRYDDAEINRNPGQSYMRAKIVSAVRGGQDGMHHTRLTIKEIEHLDPIYEFDTSTFKGYMILDI